MPFTTVRHVTFVLLIAAAVVGSPMAFGAGSTEKLTSLPLIPGLSFQQTVASAVCGKKATVNLYDAAPDASLEKYIAWHKQQLKNFYYVHKVWAGRAQELFYSPDGSKAIGITGMPGGDGVFAVAYMKLSSNLTTHQEDLFSPDNPACK